MPSLKLFLCTNHRPVIKDSSHAMWRRIRLVPFKACFKGEAVDVGLFNKLVAEAEGILAWMVEGFMASPEREPEVPKAVQAANQEYQNDSDILGQFIEQECEIRAELKVPKGDFYDAYVEWHGPPCELSRDLSKRMTANGYIEKRGAKGVRCWQGIGLSAKNLGAEGDVR